MDVKVITRHAPSNYGSLLQTYASATVLRSLGHEVTIIDYQPLADSGTQLVNSQAASKQGWKNNPLFRTAYKVLRLYWENRAYNRFEKFRHTILPLTPLYRESALMKNLEADLFVTGSDQVWGPAGGKDLDTTYMLDFVSSPRRRVAWAASFGRTEFTADTAAECRHRLEGYKKITVRESAAADTISGWGLEKPAQVLDPTLMLDADTWRAFVSAQNVPARHGAKRPYLLIYQLHNNPAMNTYAVEAARKLNLEVVRVTPSFHQISRPGHMVYLPTPQEFLSLIDNAAFMVTDSFHGTAFAITFHTPFATFLPTNGTSSRNESLLTLLGLQDRIVGTATDFSPILRSINYDIVDTKLKDERARSLEILKSLIQ